MKRFVIPNNVDLDVDIDRTCVLPASSRGLVERVVSMKQVATSSNPSVLAAKPVVIVPDDDDDDNEQAPPLSPYRPPLVSHSATEVLPHRPSQSVTTNLGARSAAAVAKPSTLPQSSSLSAKSALKSRSELPAPKRPKLDKDLSTTVSSAAGSRSQSLSTPTPFSQLLRGAVFVISGIENPQRSELREKILEMGGEYNAEWCETSTHLIAAYDNTPKSKKAVAAGGTIVRSDFIHEIYRRKCLVSIEAFAIGVGSKGSFVTATTTTPTPTAPDSGDSTRELPSTTRDDAEQTVRADDESTVELRDEESAEAKKIEAPR